MRVEATVPSSRGKALDDLARQLGLSRSQIVDEALGLFLKAVVEVMRGRRVVTVGAEGGPPACEMSTPTLAQIEWTAHRQKLTLPTKAAQRIAELVEHPPEPTESLRKAMSSRR